MKLYAVLFGIFLLASAGLYWYIDGSQKTIKQLTEDNTKLSLLIESQNDAINILQKSHTIQTRELDNLRVKNSELAKEKLKLSDKLLKHDWEELSRRKPVLMENRLNNGTKELFDSLITITTD